MRNSTGSVGNGITDGGPVAETRREAGLDALALLATPPVAELIWRTFSRVCLLGHSPIHAARTAALRVQRHVARIWETAVEAQTESALSALNPLAEEYGRQLGVLEGQVILARFTLSNAIRLLESEDATEQARGRERAAAALDLLNGLAGTPSEAKA